MSRFLNVQTRETLFLGNFSGAQSKQPGGKNPAGLLGFIKEGGVSAFPA
jgi:hypothetical protein